MKSISATLFPWIKSDYPHQVGTTIFVIVFESITVPYLEFQLDVSSAAMGFVLQISL